MNEIQIGNWKSEIGNLKTLFSDERYVHVERATHSASIVEGRLRLDAARDVATVKTKRVTRKLSRDLKQVSMARELRDRYLEHVNANEQAPLPQGKHDISRTVSAVEGSRVVAVNDPPMPLLAAGLPRKEAVDRATTLLGRLGLANRADAVPSTLSGGQQQRVAIARALVHEPRVIVCDEPTAALDHASGEGVMNLLATSAVKPDRAVIVVTHDSRVFDYADSIATMDDGRIVEVTRRGGSPPLPPAGAHEATS